MDFIVLALIVSKWSVYVPGACFVWCVESGDWHNHEILQRVLLTSLLWAVETSAVLACAA